MREVVASRDRLIQSFHGVPNLTPDVRSYRSCCFQRMALFMPDRNQSIEESAIAE
ncbi:MAG: hypothetical protein OJF50_002719 [Nitrospira sp.]|nr:hypothetical protein [Nitrospira sp.]